MKTLYGFLFSLPILMFSCQKDDVCLDAKIPNLVVQVLNMADSTAYTVPLQVTGLNKDSVIQATQGKLLLPLRLDRDRVTYIFTIQAKKDTLRLSYRQDLEWVSKACGFRVVYKNLKVLDTPYFSSDRSQTILHIENATVENDSELHLRIYY